MSNFSHLGLLRVQREQTSPQWIWLMKTDFWNFIVIEFRCCFFENVIHRVLSSHTNLWCNYLVIADCTQISINDYIHLERHYNKFTYSFLMNPILRKSTSVFGKNNSVPLNLYKGFFETIMSRNKQAGLIYIDLFLSNCETNN